jgi:septum formation protein
VRFVLASESARRVDLLRRMGYDFEARKSEFPEVVLADPKETVGANARGKALAVAEGSGEVVLAADTIVYLPDLPATERILGQARSEEEVRRMLGSLRGRLHEVHSAVALARGDELVVRHAVTKVRMRSLGEEEIRAYARLGEGVGKAGGYAIQGQAALLVEWIGGDYTNVVGLPLALTVRMLAGFGINPYRAATH